MIVVDTNVIAAAILDSQWSAAVERLLVLERDWAAPLLWRSEFRNLLATQIRAGRLDLDVAVGMSDAAESVLAGHEYSVESAPVIRLASETRCTAYDCEFVVLAQHLGVPLVTLDRRVIAAFPSIAIELEAAARRKT